MVPVTEPSCEDGVTSGVDGASTLDRLPPRSKAPFRAIQKQIGITAVVDDTTAVSVKPPSILAGVDELVDQTLGIMPPNKHVQDFDVLLEARFVSDHDGWHQFLCMQCKEDKTLTLSNRWREILGTIDAFSEYYDEDTGEYYLPEEVNGKKVWDMKGLDVLGEDLVLIWDDPDREITLAPGERERALLWLFEQGWDDKDGYAEAWAQIAGVLGVDPSITPATKPSPQGSDIRSWMPETRGRRRERWSGLEDIRFRTEEEALALGMRRYSTRGAWLKSTSSRTTPTQSSGLSES